MTDSQSQKGWKRGITAPERHYQSNVKQALLLRLLGVLDSQHLLEEVRQWYTQKTEQQGEVTSRSDRARQTPELLGPGKGAKRRPESPPLRTT